MHDQSPFYRSGCRPGWGCDVPRATRLGHPRTWALPLGLCAPSPPITSFQLQLIVSHPLMHCSCTGRPRCPSPDGPRSALRLLLGCPRDRYPPRPSLHDLMARQSLMEPSADNPASTHDVASRLLLLHGLFLIPGALLVLFLPQPSLSATQKSPGEDFRDSTPGSEHAL